MCTLCPYLCFGHDWSRSQAEKAQAGVQQLMQSPSAQNRSGVADGWAPPPLRPQHVCQLGKRPRQHIRFRRRAAAPRGPGARAAAAASACQRGSTQVRGLLPVLVPATGGAVSMHMQLLVAGTCRSYNGIRSTAAKSVKSSLSKSGTLEMPERIWWVNAAQASAGRSRGTSSSRSAADEVNKQGASRGLV